MNEHDKLTSLISNAMNDYVASVTDSELIKPSEFVADYLIKRGVVVISDCDGCDKCAAYCSNCNRRGREVTIK